ncbi:MAG: 4'-phosphopantetheinyl transferase superfamily protein [Acidobacteria bacterium]|nr:4'-phosphopantetheinyl transferase superfamily protein [Acidobacteriota bacterium]
MLASTEHSPPVSVAETLAGTAGIVDLWYWRCESATESALVESCDPLITPDERDRFKRFRFERDRCLFLATRALVRTVLSRYANVVPGDWRFASDKSGKPRIGHPAITPALHFNLANTAGLVVCVVSVAHEPIGVDAERIDREVDFIGLADRYFSASEACTLRALPSREVPRRFFAYWTLKESYVKARGMGLALPLDQFSFTIAGPVISVAFDPPTAEDETRWRFALIDASPCHIIAVGANTGGAALSLRATHIVPIESGLPLE